MRRLLVFVKAPIPGHVKTRLAQEIGPEAAVAVYRASVELTLSRLRPLHEHTTLCIDPPDAIPEIQQWVGPGWRTVPQHGRDLGERLAQATARAFSDGARYVVVIGTDSPWVRIEDIGAAFDALASAEVVLGPTDDGGYYLIGLSRPSPAMFEDIDWSTPAVCDQTLVRARTLGLRAVRLKIGYDLDHLQDVQRFITEERQRGEVPQAVDIMTTLTYRRFPCRS